MARDESQKDEQAKIVDKLLRQLPHANPTLSDVDRRPRGDAPRGDVARRASGAIGTQVGVPRQPVPPTPLAVWSRVGVGILFAVGLTQWPYAHSCGWPLIGYCAAIMLVGVAGVWGGVFSWRAHMAVPHLIALFLVGWWAVLAARIVLPRTGYAAERATWWCSDESIPAADQVPTLTPIQAQPAEAALDALASDSLQSGASSNADSANAVRDSIPRDAR